MDESNHLHTQRIAFAISIILITGIGAFLVSHFPTSTTSGFVTTDAISLSTEKKSIELAVIDYSHPREQTETIRYVWPDGSIVDEEVTQTFWVRKDTRGNDAGFIQQKVKRKINQEQVAHAQEYAHTQVSQSAVTATGTTNSTAYFQAIPVGSAVIPPSCVKPQDTMAYSGKLRFCPGTYTLSSGFYIVGPAIIDATGVTINGPGLCKTVGGLYECRTAITILGKDVTLSNIKISKWGRGIFVGPEYVWSPLT
ncbi:MAG: hypothetical protein AABX02_04505, partial [archaeon]